MNFQTNAYPYTRRITMSFTVKVAKTHGRSINMKFVLYRITGMGVVKVMCCGMDL